MTTSTNPIDPIDEILATLKAGNYQGYTDFIEGLPEAKAKLNQLILEKQIEAKILYAAKLSILDQEITRLKAENIRLEQLRSKQ